MSDGKNIGISMSRDEFIKRYYEIAKRALALAEKAMKDGLLAIEDDLDQEKINNRDIFEYGLNLVTKGFDIEIIDDILSNIIDQEKDECIKNVKYIQRQAVRLICEGTHPILIQAALNSFTELPLNKDCIILEDKTRKSAGY